MFSIFKTFFLLGWVSFGGPAAHIGYFRHTFVEKLNWLTEAEYAQIVALSQFLPGPGSSQVGFAIGHKKAGTLGAIAAFLGFTLPSVLIMLALALLSSQITDSSWFVHSIHGLKLLAVVVVADATLSMYRNFCTQKTGGFLCLSTAVALLILPSLFTQIAMLIIAALIGQKYLAGELQTTVAIGKFNPAPLLIFALLVFGLPLIADLSPVVSLFSEFFQAGSLVFGGGHVVLPLLQNIVGDQLSQDAFLTGYAAAQAVPGPMFTFATYIGYHLMPSAPLLGAGIATIAVFIPGFLLLMGVLQNWQNLAKHHRLSGAISGVNAAVVGLLVSALYQPVFVSAVLSGVDMAAVLFGFYLLKNKKMPIVGLVAVFITIGLTTGYTMSHI
ncbi:chromate efflux transporter [Vibrio tapetis subsp. quintayensis]|uniref:chromate efflux transporter n=1 Tax=Vibrio tapetis TaxID=52443 RepID=UPI0025B289DB|nr:chromate efflux transporter [Vibrio tapetis]MDN3681419.1 chromate efflux transporter [Vibrio tapetis subsp. quintayensis]